MSATEQQPAPQVDYSVLEGITTDTLANILFQL